MTIVKTRDELKAAQKSGAAEIIVIGELADKLKKTKKIASLSAAGLAALVAATGVATVTGPFTGGASFLGLGAVAALTGLEIAAVISAAAIGIGLILAIATGYEEISYKNGHLILRKKSKQEKS